MSAEQACKTLMSLADGRIAAHSKRFFKTGKGEYGEGDRFLGVRVPVIRKQVKAFRDLSLEDIERLLESPYHEIRLFALLLLVDRFSSGSDKDRKNVYEIYLRNTRFINNWDLVDSSAHHIVGAYLETRDKEPLRRLAISEVLWERRIAIIATHRMIKSGEFDETLKIARILLHDKEDLIHKAVGWMLREVGNRDPSVESAFLEKHYREMPRTMLRYAIEKFPQAQRRSFLDRSTS